MDEQTLVRRAALQDVVTRYFRGLDNNDPALVRSCFADDVQAVYADRPVGRGVDGLMESLKTFGRRERGELLAMTHFMGNFNLLDLQDDVAETETYAIAFMVPTQAVSARMTVRGLRYLDRLRRVDGQWRITRRRHTLNWSFEETPTFAIGMQDRVGWAGALDRGYAGEVDASRREHATAGVRQLADRDAIQDVIGRYYRALDAGDKALVRTCFTDDVRTFYEGRPPAAGIEGLMDNFRTFRRIENGDMQLTLHFMGNFNLLRLQETSAETETYAIAFLVSSAAASGKMAVRGLRYLDRLRRDEGPQGAWRIAQRQHTLDWSFEAHPGFASSFAERATATAA